jgi:putative ATP-binding cassette transporter
MDLLAFLFRSSHRMVLGMVLVSIVSGVLGAAFIAIIHQALSESGFALRSLALGFVAVVLARTATQFTAQAMLVRFGQDVILKLCCNLCDRVLAAPLDRLEALGSPRLLATLNDDVQTLSAAVQAIPMLATNFAVLVGCSAYLAWLSWPALLLSISMVLGGVAGYRMLLRRAHSAFRIARDGRDRLFGNFRTLIEGI